MVTKENTGNLIQLLASYRRVEFPQDPLAAPRLARIAGTVENNCAVTIRFADAMFRKFEEDGEELFCICSLREQALALQRACRSVSTARGRRTQDVTDKFVTLRSQYDMFISSIRHFFFLLDHDLAGRIDGAL
jgi:hypothetical protein